jgi:hypothetical protein
MTVAVWEVLYDGRRPISPTEWMHRPLVDCGRRTTHTELERRRRTIGMPRVSVEAGLRMCRATTETEGGEAIYAVADDRRPTAAPKRVSLADRTRTTVLHLSADVARSDPLVVEREATVPTPNGTVGRKIPLQAATLGEAAAIFRCSVEDVRLVADEGGVARHLAFDIVQLEAAMHTHLAAVRARRQK